MPWSEFTALLLLATAVSFTPGPNTTLSTAIAANRGLRGALRFVCAVPVGWCALLLLCAAGLGAGELVLEFGARVLQQLRIARHHQHLRAEAEQFAADRQSDPGAGAGHQRALSVQRPALRCAGRG